MTIEFLRSLQLADSGFPTGSFGYSWGLETAVYKGFLTKNNFSLWFESEMLDRWAFFDRIILSEAWRKNIHNFSLWEKKIDRFFWSKKQKKDSIGAGRVYLESLTRFGSKKSSDLLKMLNENKIFGHLSALQGITYKRMGLSRNESMLVGAHVNSQSLISAAVRLNVVSSMNGQIYYSEIIPKLADLCSRKCCEDDIGGFFPSGEIALLSFKPNSLFIN